MQLKTIKTSTFAIALLASFTFAGCGEKQAENTSATQDQHAGMDHSGHEDKGNQVTPGKEVVQVPDYGSAGEAVKLQIDQVLTSYLNLKEALVASNGASAQTEARAVVAAADKVNLSTLSSEERAFAQEKIGEVKQSATKIAQTSEVNAQRGHLELLSEATFSLAKAFKVSNKPLYYQHCPMANNDQGAYWVSATKEIRNPYFGDQMLKCGGTEEVLN